MYLTVELPQFKITEKYAEISDGNVLALQALFASNDRALLSVPVNITHNYFFESQQIEKNI
jgi:hypothetical protein